MRGTRALSDGVRVGRGSVTVTRDDQTDFLRGRRICDDFLRRPISAGHQLHVNDVPANRRGWRILTREVSERGYWTGIFYPQPLLAKISMLGGLSQWSTCELAGWPGHEMRLCSCGLRFAVGAADFEPVYRLAAGRGSSENVVVAYGYARGALDLDIASTATFAGEVLYGIATGKRFLRTDRFEVAALSAPARVAAGLRWFGVPVATHEPGAFTCSSMVNTLGGVLLTEAGVRRARSHR